MNDSTCYRWKTSDFAIGYDAAAHVVHPHYREIQDILLGLLSLPAEAPALVVDLGGGSGRLVERILDRWPQATGIVIDFSEPFLALAERRLQRFGPRAACIRARLQEDWPSQLDQPPAAIVSMSAIHHLEPDEKRSLYGRCCQVLAAKGLFLNGDEVRSLDEREYLARLSAWADHMRAGMTSGRIPPVFHAALDAWIDRNVMHFGEPKRSGDDCHETIAAQLATLRAVEFESADCPWQRDLWGVLRGVKAGL